VYIQSSKQFFAKISNEGLTGTTKISDILSNTTVFKSIGGGDIPMAPTAPAGTSTDQIATTAFVTGAISDTKTWLTTLPFYNARPQVNVDWSATSGVAQILNKPTTIAGYGITDAYTKTDVDSKDTNSISVAKSYTDTAIANLVNSAPSTLDTLKEIDDQLSKDESVVAALTNTVGTKAPLASPVFTGQVFIPEGTVSLPGLVFQNDGANDPGFYHI
jgi:hypothetical protein